MKMAALLGVVAGTAFDGGGVCGRWRPDGLAADAGPHLPLAQMQLQTSAPAATVQGGTQGVLHDELLRTGAGFRHPDVELVRDLPHPIPGEFQRQLRRRYLREPARPRALHQVPRGARHKRGRFRYVFINGGISRRRYRHYQHGGEQASQDGQPGNLRQMPHGILAL